MKTFLFLFRESKNHLGKTISTILSIILLIVSVVGIFFVYKNITSATGYYSSSSIGDATRIEITADNNLLTLFTHRDSWIKDTDMRSILADKSLTGTEIFTLVEYPVVAKFSLFSFWLETDIPIFALSGWNLKENEIGISQKMLDYYNAQFAGSSAMFPEIGRDFLIGQSVIITVGQSKLFNINQTAATPITAHIADINPSYPWFWLILRENVLQNKLKEIGQNLGNPYKIVTHMTNSHERESIEKKYKHLAVSFDADKIQDLEKKLSGIRMIFSWILITIGCILSVIIGFLLGSILRESTSRYNMIQTFGIPSLYSWILTIGEPLLIILIATIISYGCLYFSINLSESRIELFLKDNGLFFPLERISGKELATILVSIYWYITLLLLVLHLKKIHSK